MKVQVLITSCAIAWMALTGVAQADTPVVQPYHYGMHLDVAKVISMSEPVTQDCKVVKADMKYLDKAGKVEEISYAKMSDACSFQN